MNMFRCKTIQGSVFRSVVEVLKEIIHDTNIHVDSTGMKILTMDSTHSCLVSLKLDAENFCEFECNGSYHIGVNMLSLFKLLKSVSSNDTISISIDENSPNEMRISVENLDKRSYTKYDLKLLDIDIETITIPDVESEVLVTIPSVDLQRITRDVTNLSDTVTITSKDETLEFSCDGDFARQCTSIGSAEHGLTFKTNGPKKEIQASYNVKYISMFCKASSVSPIMEIHLKENYPLIMRFPISLGVIQFVLAPKAKDDDE